MRFGTPYRRIQLAFLLLSTSAGALPGTEEPLPPNYGQESELLRAAGPGFAIKRTPHFLVAYNGERSMVDDFTARLEQTYQSIYRFCEINKIEAHRPGERLEVIFFDQRTDYDRYGQAIGFLSTGTYGLYHELTNRSAFYNAHNDPELRQLHASLLEARESLDRMTQAVEKVRNSRARLTIEYEDGRRATMTRAEVQQEIDKSRRELKTLDARQVNYSERINHTVVQHEVAHQVLFNAGVHPRGGLSPKWIVEGLACMFEPVPDALGGNIGAINQIRLRDFRRFIAGSEHRTRLATADLLSALAEDRIIDLRKLVTDQALFNERGERGATVYATTWALTHYLQRVRPQELAAYLRELGARTPTSRPAGSDELALFEKHFGPLDRNFLQRWGDYMLKVTYRPPPGRR